MSIGVNDAQVLSGGRAGTDDITSFGDMSNTTLVGFGANSIVGAVNELKNSNVQISHNDYLDWALNYKARAEGSNLNVNNTLNGLFFDTFADSTKFDSVNSTSSGTIQVQNPAAPKPTRVVLLMSPSAIPPVTNGS